jgi:carbon-monoxide dehydrogenase medium subunit
MHDFSYHRPAHLGEAGALLKTSADPKLLAGGMTLIPTLKQRLANPSDVIDLGRIASLKGIRRENGMLVIGAMTCHADVAASSEVRGVLPALAELADGIGDPAVRHRGTIGGSIANADPAADYPAGVVGLDAVVVTSERQIKADAFFLALFTTALGPAEIITEVRCRIPDKAHYLKFRHPASGYAVVGVMVARYGSAVRVGITGAGPSAFRATEMEAALAKSFSPQALSGIKIAPDGLLGDIHCSAPFRAHLVEVLAKRAVAAIA